jgi:hypothetical protein
MSKDTFVKILKDLFADELSGFVLTTQQRYKKEVERSPGNRPVFSRLRLGIFQLPRRRGVAHRAAGSCAGDAWA